MAIVRRGCGVALGLLLSVPAAAAEPEERVLGRKAEELFKTYCYRCHGQNGTNEGGFNYVLDRQRLVGRRKIVPGNAAKSRLFRRVTDSDDPMPPVEEKLRPRAEDIALIKVWIEKGAPEAAPVATARGFIAPQTMVQAIHDDLLRLHERDRRFTRYFTLTHLHNAELSAEEIHSYRHGLSKLLNSLSWGKHIVVPRPVDTEATILRIDLRDYQWNERTWEVLLQSNPYGIALAGPIGKECSEFTGCKLPYLRADWFVAVASRPPLYHDILQIPGTEAELQKVLRVDVGENIRQERVVRAGFNGSGVSRNNRLIERHEAGATVYWRSYDFGGNTGRQNLFSHPLGPGDDGNHFTEDGGEIIFSLPNGLQAYMLVDGRGRRIDKGPTAIVSDPRRPDRAVENGLSCISCHARGIIDKADQIRGHVLGNRAAFSASNVDAVLALYPPRDKMAALMRGDAKRFQEAVARTGAPLSITEPIAALATRFESELDLALAAAEAGVTPRDFLNALERFPHLGKALGPVRTEGGTVQRQVYVATFGDIVLALRLGDYLLSPSAAVSRLIDRGHTLLQKGDAAGALSAFNEAADMQPGNPLVHAGRGDVFRTRGEHGQAVAAYTEALRLDSLAAGVFNNRGMAYSKLGQHEKALADFAEALRLNPRFAVAYHNRGAAEFAQGKLERAIADYTEAIRLNAAAPVTFNNRGYAYFERGDYDLALADFKQALRLQPTFAVAFNNRGLAHHRKKQHDRAIADFSAAIKIDPKFARAYLNRSLALESIGDTVRAEADRRKGRDLDPNIDE